LRLIPAGRGVLRAPLITIRAPAPAAARGLLPVLGALLFRGLVLLHLFRVVQRRVVRIAEKRPEGKKADDQDNDCQYRNDHARGYLFLHSAPPPKGWNGPSNGLPALACNPGVPFALSSPSDHSQRKTRVTALPASWGAQWI